jgi:SET domain-containing protein
MEFPNSYLTPWRDPRIDVKNSSIQGLGMFAKESIQAGDVVIIWGGRIFTAEDISAGKARATSISILDDGLYLADEVRPAGEVGHASVAEETDSPDYYLNHSCDPNVWMEDEITLVARCAILPSQELTADYALWEQDPTWKILPCQCGASCCRGKVTGNDWQLPELQQRYQGHFIPYLNKRIEHQKTGVTT